VIGEPPLGCDTGSRRQLLLDSDLNGIDHVEVPFDDQHHLRVYFVKDPVPAVTAAQVGVEGGVRVRGIEVVAVSVEADAAGVDHLAVTVDHPGDFSAYTLHVDAGLDPRFARARFGFKAGCPSPFDCLREPDCPPEAVEVPVIDYQAKDYASFRHLLLDGLATRVPGWSEHHEADVGVALVELLAYEGDHLSYAQDAAANELHLETARQRESVRRHVRLVDYPMHHGINAKAFVCLTVETAGVVPARSLRCPERTVRFATRILEPVDPASRLPPGPVVAQAHVARALAVAGAVFEPVAAATVHPALNRVPVHAWGDTRCCLPAGAISVDLVGDLPLAAGDLLLLEEVRGVVTGLAADADPDHRQVVRLTAVAPTEDPLLTADEGAPTGARPRGPADPPLPVTRVAWGVGDALRFPLCVSTVDEAGGPILGVAVARGNVVLVDHGATVTESHVPDEGRVRFSQIAYRFRLRRGPLTFGFPLGFVPTGSAASAEEAHPRRAEPHAVVVDGDGSGFTWLPHPDLLNADPFTRGFVAEPDHDGQALVRFGDGVFGRRPSFATGPDQVEATRLRVIYRVGNGREGNVGREAIAHLLEPEQFPPAWPAVAGVRNPLPARGGTDPEPVALVKQVAPDAFRAESYRAVTEADYARAAELLPEVSHARATFRWTGSWHTVFVTVDPRGTDELTPATERAVLHHLARYRQAGYDLEVEPPRYVPLEIGFVVCAGPGHFRADVAEAVGRALGAGVLPGGTRGFFHPDNFTFGQPLHLSRLYAAVEAVPGVDSAEVVVFRRFGQEPAGELEAGRIEVGRLEVVRLANDPNFPEHGVLRIEMRGGT
jgi:hypothetical protein